MNTFDKNESDQAIVVGEAATNSICECTCATNSIEANKIEKEIDITKTLREISISHNFESAILDEEIDKTDNVLLKEKAAINSIGTTSAKLPLVAPDYLAITALSANIAPATTTITSPTVLFIPHLPHVASEPTFGIVSRRNQQHEKIKNYHDAKQNAVRGSESSPSSGVVVKIGSVSNSTSPNMCRKTSESSLPRRVSFPKSDNELVTGYLEPANPWEHACIVSSISELAELYELSCKKHNTTPLQTVLDHLKAVDLKKKERQPLLCLKSIKLAPCDCEALEEVFKRVQYKSIDLSSCELNESAVSALFDMIEYYEAANELDISSNAIGMSQRGWTSCTYMIGRSRELQVLNAQGNPISKLSAENLGVALNTSNLHTIKLEHCGLKGTPLSGLCHQLRNNRMLKELWLAYNDLDCRDAETIADLLKTNHFIELLDLSNNNIRDEGLSYIVQALIVQARELENRSILQRAAAIDDDDILLPVEQSQNLNVVIESSSNDSNKNTDKILTDCSDSRTHIEKCHVGGDTAAKLEGQVKQQFKTCIYENEADAADINIKTNTIKNVIHESGQSMLDKLLSMNTDTSSHDSALATNSTSFYEETTTTNDDVFEGAKTTNCNKNAALIAPSSVKIATLPSSIFSAESATTVNRMHRLYLEDRDTSNFGPVNTNKSKTQNVPECIKDILKNDKKPNLDQDGLEEESRNDIQTLLRPADIFEVKARESDCLISVALDRSENDRNLMQQSTNAIEMNNHNNKQIEDDTHSTDSAFESASESDISRHLPEEFNRLSTSFDSTRLYDMAREFSIETATIATESAESLVEAPTPTSSFIISSEMCAKGSENGNSDSNRTSSPTLQITAASKEENSDILVAKLKSRDTHDVSRVKIALQNFLEPRNSPTPPPPLFSPGGACFGMHRNESACTFITQATRNSSQSSDSLCSDNSFDGSITSDQNSSSTQLNEKLTKNDTLSRQQRQLEPPTESSKVPCGLKALALWSNNLTKEAGLSISDLLANTTSLELLNIGKNCLSNEFVMRIKDSLIRNTTMTTLGLQSAHLSAKGIEALSSIVTFGGNSTLQRIDIRDNKLEAECLSTLADVLKSNTTITQIDIDDEPKRLSVGSEAHMDYARVLENVRALCSRNEKTLTQIIAEKSANSCGTNKRRGGYYVGSRKISLTCHSRPLIEAVVPTPVCNKLEIKRKTGARLRSPIPSPPTISPSSSPNRSRFQVSRVPEASPLTSPLTQTQNPPNYSSPTSNVSIPTFSVEAHYNNKFTSSSLPTSNSMSSMATVTSSTESIRRLSTSPRSRFQVSKIYEDPKVPLYKRELPPITPPLNPPPTPTLKSATVSATPNSASVVTSINTTINTYVATNTINQNTVNVDLLSHTTNNESTNTNTKTKNLISTPSPLNSSFLSSSTSSPLSFSPATLSSSPVTSSSITLASPAPECNISNNRDNPNIIDDNIVDFPTLTRCPIAIFNDNDITLTRNSGSSAFSNFPAVEDTPSKLIADNVKTVGDETTSSPLQPRMRKVSWISNQTTVDKLLTLFHSPGTIFQRNLSPELKIPSSSHLNSESGLDTILTQQIYDQQQMHPDLNQLATTRKNSPPSWSKLGTDLLNASSTEGGTSTAMTNAAALTLEQSKAFLDVASKQFRDLSKQVFRQKPACPNEVGVSADISISDGLNNSNNSCESSNIFMPEHDATVIPRNMKKEIKENISPEHTINEEQLHNLQKLCETADIAAYVGNEATDGSENKEEGATCEIFSKESLDIASNNGVVNKTGTGDEILSTHLK